jgi:hypothetical protein
VRGSVYNLRLRGWMSGRGCERRRRGGHVRGRPCRLPCREAHKGVGHYSSPERDENERRVGGQRKPQVHHERESEREDNQSGRRYEIAIGSVRPTTEGSERLVVTFVSGVPAHLGEHRF